MEKKAFALAVLAIVVGSALLQLYMRNYEHEVTGGAMVSVVIATRDAATGQPITHDMLGVRELPQRYLESRHIRAGDIGQIVGQRLASSTKANEFLLWTDLASVGTRARSLADLVQEGMRAVAVHARQGGFGELLQPGDRVDVLLVRDHEPRVDAVVALLQNVLVLAIGNTVLQAGEDPATQPHGAGAVTLSLSAEQARQLAYGETQGYLRLLLRNPTDTLVDDATRKPQLLADDFPAKQADPFRGSR